MGSFGEMFFVEDHDRFHGQNSTNATFIYKDYNK